VKPPLAARPRGPAVPGDLERLGAAARKSDEVLLERRDAERVRDVEVTERAVRPVGARQELPLAPRVGVGAGLGASREHALTTSAKIDDARSVRSVAASLCGPEAVRSGRPGARTVRAFEARPYAQRRD
jgi:hypothetical protein